MRPLDLFSNQYVFASRVHFVHWVLKSKLLFFLQCREIGYEIHEEVLKVLHELHTAMKTHHNYQSEFRSAENKLQVIILFLVIKTSVYFKMNQQNRPFTTNYKKLQISLKAKNSSKFVYVLAK